MSLIAGQQPTRRGNKPSASSVPTQMPTNEVISRGRRLAGSAALIATGAGLATLAVHDTSWIEWGLLAVSGLVTMAGVGLSRREVAVQTLSRAAAWTVLIPSGFVTAFSMLSGRTDLVGVALAAGSLGSLVLARPMLDTAEARAAFAPTSFRRWLMGWSTSSATAGLVTGVFALDALRWHPFSAIPLLGLSFALLASAIGVVRMRAWGILLGALTSIVTLIAAAVLHNPAGLLLMVAALPGFMLLLPVLVAQRQRAKAEAASASFTRVSSHVSFDDAPRVRVATPATTTEDDGFDSREDAVVAPAPQAARAQA